MAENVVKYKKPININIGMIIFFFIIVYVIFNVFSYMTRVTISEYQVSQGAIASNNIYHGLILRDETVVYSNQSGYINYYVKNAKRVSVNDIVYSVDTVGSISNAIHNAGENGLLLNDFALSEISEQIDIFSGSFDPVQFAEASNFKADLNSQMAQIMNTLAVEQLQETIVHAEANNTFYKYCAPKTGVVAYYVDGYEAYKIEDFKKEWLSSVNYSKANLNSNDQVYANGPAYKLIDKEDWNIVIEISKEMAESLKDNSNIRIRFCKDDFSTNAAYELFELDNQWYMNLKLRTAMVRYINERFVDIELSVHDKSGLKIPISSITQKEFFTIPKDYFIQGGDSSAYGVMVENTELEQTGTTVDFVTPTIYYDKDKYYYIDAEYVQNGDILIKPDSSDVYVVGQETASLTGVYNINKGYAVFKQINIIYQNDEYAIVEPKTSYGIALYDHIALDGSKLKEDQLIKK